jgi:hypothetical protein
LKAVVAWLPTAVSAAKNLTTLWETLGPTIKAYLGIRLRGVAQNVGLRAEGAPDNQIADPKGLRQRPPTHVFSWI